MKVLNYFYFFFNYLGHLQVKNGSKREKETAVTYLSFSPNGRELLANMGNEQVYLFDVTRKHSPKYFTIPNVPMKNCNEKGN